MPLILIYILIPTILIGIATILNFKFKWVTQKDIESDIRQMRDDPSSVLSIIIAIVAWPLVLTLITIVLIIRGMPTLIKNLIPPTETKPHEPHLLPIPIRKYRRHPLQSRPIRKIFQKM